MAKILKLDVSVSTILDSFKEAVHELYTKNSEKIIKLVEIYGDSLKKNGNVRYCGTSDYGVLALIDSSECPVRIFKVFRKLKCVKADIWS